MNIVSTGKGVAIIVGALVGIVVIAVVLTH
jgi:hypothetical protein